MVISPVGGCAATKREGTSRARRGLSLKLACERTRWVRRKTMPKFFVKAQVLAVPFLLLVSVLCAGQAPLPEPVTDQETELGLAVYNELKEKGEIVESSTLYDS